MASLNITSNDILTIIDTLSQLNITLPTSSTTGVQLASMIGIWIFVLCEIGFIGVTIYFRYAETIKVDSDTTSTVVQSPISSTTAVEMESTTDTTLQETMASFATLLENTSAAIKAIKVGVTN